ncbi:MAG TPA: cell division protein ZapA [Bacteroidales bacterium]|nr:cell division protein ZapA [Bacteroidales bacterium]
MDELSISVTIADRPYRLKIEKTDEETIRKAAKLIEKTMKEYSVNYAFKDKQDLLAMVALQFVTSSLNFESQIDFTENKLETKLSEIDHVLSEVI